MLLYRSTAAAFITTPSRDLNTNRIKRGCTCFNQLRSTSFDFSTSTMVFKECAHKWTTVLYLCHPSTKASAEFEPLKDVQRCSLGLPQKSESIPQTIYVMWTTAPSASRRCER